MNFLTLCLLLIPAIATTLLLIPPSLRPAISARQITLAAALLNALLTLTLAAGYLIHHASSASPAYSILIPWIQLSQLTHGVIPDINFHIAVDGNNLPLLLLTAIVSLAAIAFRTSKTDPQHVPTYAALLLITLGAYGAFLSLDAFFLYIFHEFALIPTFLLIYFYGQGAERKIVALKLTLYLTLGSIVLLIGLISLIQNMPTGVRTFDLRTIHEYFSIHTHIIAGKGILPFTLIFIGAAILFSLFPLHSWAPMGYALAPTPVAMLHAGVLKKFGLYVLLRIAYPALPQAAEQLSPWIAIALLANILFIGFVTLRQTHLNVLLGYSSVMHIGYIVLGLISWNSIGVTGALLLMLAHGISAALLFALSAEIQLRADTLEMKKIGGLIASAPRLALLFIIASMASIGLPGLANFTGEILIFLGAWKSGLYLVVILALWGIVISATYQLRAIQWIFFATPIDPKRPHIHDITPISHWHYYLLATALVVLGVAPFLLTPSIQSALAPYFTP